MTGLNPINPGENHGTKGLALGDGITRWRTGKRQRVGNDKVPMWNSKWAGLTKCGKHISFSSCSLMFHATWCNFFLKVCDLRLGCFSTTVLTHTTHGKWTDGRYSSYTLLDTCSAAANLKSHLHAFARLHHGNLMHRFLCRRTLWVASQKIRPMCVIVTYRNYCCVVQIQYSTLW
jgi:hypothetical protein